MPLTVNVGLSRKASRDYQSTGVSINVTAELDQALLAKPDELQAQVADLYRQAEIALDRQTAAAAPAAAIPARRNTASATPRAGNNGHTNGHANGHTNASRNAGGMTASQRKAIEAIARRARLDPAQEAHDLFGVSLDDLTIRQASEMIDSLKGQTEGAPTRR